MNQFRAIFAFEFAGIVKSKFYIVITAALAVILAVLLSLPGIIAFFEGDSDSAAPGGEENAGEEGTVAVADASDGTGTLPDLSLYVEIFASYAPEYEFVIVKEDEESLKESLEEEVYEGALLLTDPLTARYLTPTSDMYGYLPEILSEAMRFVYLTALMENAGMSSEDAALAAVAYPTVTTVETGKAFMSSYICTYVMIMLLYMAVLLYGNMVATSVATEKSSRAMELLITTAKPSALMFGKVLGVGMAAMMQLGIWVLTAGIFYVINRESYAAMPLVGELLNVGADSVIYLLVFFILGFFLYAFMFGAMGSTISRLEESNTASFPIIFLILIAFIVSMTAMSSGNTETPLVVVTSFIPFFSPMVMYVRISMGSVPAWQIVLAVSLMVGGNVLVGYLASRIYKLGVVMYGKPPKLHELFRMLSRDKKSKR